nr:MAG TPA: helix-turn-helix domain protein [Caudoviricetes sp.]
MKQQANNRRSNHTIKYIGVSHTISEWADILGVNQTTL